MRIVTLISMLIVIASAGCERQSPGTIQPAERERLESLVRIPSDTDSQTLMTVGQYKRYYAVTFLQGRRTIKGLFVRDDEPGVYPVASDAEFPAILDGGCGVVHVLYDVEAERILELHCNGVA